VSSEVDDRWSATVIRGFAGCADTYIAQGALVMPEWEGSGVTVSNGPMWKVFVSHTSELRDFPPGGSYIAEVERAISAAGHVIVNMADFPATDTPAADVCIRRVEECDVFVGVLGARYGSPVRDYPQVSYSELEFDTAAAKQLPRLMFTLDLDAEVVGLPVKALQDLEHGARQNVFRDRVRNAGLVKASFRNPDDLRGRLADSLRELADTRRRIDAGLNREKQPAEPRPAAGTKFVNPQPMSAPIYFADRHVESGLLGECLADPGMRLVTVVGRGGIGKTAMVCRLLKGLEAGAVPDQPRERTHMGVNGIVYLSKNGLHPVTFDSLVSDLGRLLPDDAAKRVEGLPKSTPPDRLMLTMLEGFPTGLVVVMLDNLETALDQHTGALLDRDLHDALVSLLQAPHHAVKVLVTTQILPSGLNDIAASAQYVLRLDEGLPWPHAEKVLRELDRDGTLGLKHASDEVLGLARERTRGFPRALEALKAVLAGDRTTILSEVLDQIRDLSAANVVKELVGKAFDGLDPESQRVMQAVAVHPAPVSVVGVDYLLQSHNPTTNAAPILSRLVNRELVRYNTRHYSLHPIDRDFALSRVATGTGDNLPGEFTLAALRDRAAEYYAEIRTPRDSWRTLDDIQPQLAEFELRCANGAWVAATEVLADIEWAYLQRWGQYRLTVNLRTQLDGRLTDPNLQVAHLTSLGYCYFSLGSYQDAISRHTDSLTIARDNADRGGESAALGALGSCSYIIGDYQAAIDRYTEALTIARDIGYREGEAIHLGNLGNCYYDLGDYQAAIDRYTEALTIDRDIGYRQGEASDLGNLGLCYYDLGDYQAAIDRHTEALTIARDIGYREGEANHLGNLGDCYYDLGEYQAAIDRHTEALTIARDVGDRRSEANVLGALGRVRWAMAETASARSLFEEAIGVADEIGAAEPVVKSRTGLARLLIENADPAQALTLLGAAEGFNYPLLRPTLLLLRGVALLGTDRAMDATQAFETAVTTADDLIVKAPGNIAALDARGLASCGLAVCSDPTQVAAAIDSFNRARATTAAAGVVAAAVRLFDVIASYDRDGVFAGLRDAIGRR
jgi:tetratricopeptide (TPR) repeat protein